MKIKTLILPAINAFLWGGMALLKFNGLSEAEVRNGRVSLNLVERYIAFPLIMVSVAVIPAAILSQTKWAYLGNVWSIITLLVLLIFSAYHGGA